MNILTQQLAEEMARKGQPKKTAGGGSGNASVEEQFEPTEHEIVFMSPPYNLKKEDILKAREKSQAKMT